MSGWSEVGVQEGRGTGRERTAVAGATSALRCPVSTTTTRRSGPLGGAGLLSRKDASCRISSHSWTAILFDTVPGIRLELFDSNNKQSWRCEDKGATRRRIEGAETIRAGHRSEYRKEGVQEVKGLRSQGDLRPPV